MASQQTAQLNLVITAKDEAASVINQAVDDIKKSLSSLQETFDKLNTFKLKNPITNAVVDNVKAQVDEINKALGSIGAKNGADPITKSPLANQAETARTQANAITSAMQSVSKEAETMQRLLTSKDVKLLPGAAASLTPIENALKTLTGDLGRTTTDVNNATNRWKSDFNGVVIDVEQDAKGIYSAVNDIGKNVKDATSWFDKLKSAASGVASRFKSMSDSVASSMSGMAVKTGEDASKVDKSFLRMKAGLAAFVLAVDKAHDPLRRGFDYMQLQFAGQQAQQWGKSITGFFGNAVMSAANFNQSVLNVAGSLRAQGETAKQVNGQLKSMNDFALKLGSQGYFSANQVADAMNVMAKQGISYKTIMSGALQAATNVAAANQEDLSQTSNVISDIVHEMGGSLVQQYGNIGSAMNHVGDQMTVALHHSRISMTDFLNSMKYAGPQASNLGVKFSDLSATIAELGQHGIRGTQAGTTLRRALQELAAPSSTALKEMQKLGLATANGTTAFTDQAGKLKPLADVQQILYERLHQLNPAQREQALQSMFSMYAVSGMTAVANTTPSAFHAMTAAMAKSGTAQQILQEKSRGVGFEVQHMKAQWQTFIKQMGELFLPLATKVIHVLTKIVGAIQSFISQHPGMARMIAIFMALAGVFLLVGGGLAAFIGTIGMFSTAIVDLIPALGGVEIAFGPILLIVGAVALAIVGLHYAWTHNLGHIRDKTHEAIQAVVKYFHSIQPELTQIKNAIVAVIKFLDPVWKAFWQSFKAIVKAMWDEIQQILQGAWKVISGLFSLFLDVLTGHWSKAWKDVKRIFSGFVEIFEAPFKAFWEALSGVFKAWVTALHTYWDRLWKAIQALWKNIVAEFEKGRQSLTTALSNVGKDIVSFFTSLPSKALSWGENMIHMFVQGIENKIADVGKTVKKVASSIGNFLGFHSPTKEGPASDSDQWMPNMMKMFQTDIQRQLPQFKATLGNVAMTMQQTMVSHGRTTPNTYNIANTHSNRGSVNITVNVNTPMGRDGKQIVDAIATTIRKQMSVVSAG